MQKERYYYIDWLRIIAFSLLILLHCMVAFTSITWEINNAETSGSLTAIVFWLHQWRLPLLFFISGMGIRLSLRSRSIAGFYGERFKRLFIPLLFAMFFTIPLQPYFEFLQDGKIREGYWDFYKGVWELKVYPDGPLTWSHMWFVVYLIAYILLLFPLVALTRIPAVNRLLEQVAKWFGSGPGLVLMTAPLFVIFFKLYIDFPPNGSLTDDWFAFLFFLTFLLYGYFIGDSVSFWELADKWKKLSGVITLVTGMLLFLYFWKPMPELVKGSKTYMIYSALVCVHVWSMLVFGCGLAKAYLNFNSPLLVYLNAAVYPYYIVHQTIIVVLGYYITGMDLPLMVKLPLLVVTSLALILSVYHFIIRKTKLTRLLFGMKR